jgi:hypothetical protein
MTQELILGALLIGIIGLIWALTCAIVGEDHRPHSTREDKPLVSPAESRQA